MKQSNDINKKLSVLMIGFGVVMGVVFPFFTKMVLGLASEQVITFKFFFVCILAGIAVGIFNFYLFKRVIYSFLDELSSKINMFKERLKHSESEEILTCKDNSCFMNVDSEDPIVGNIGHSFNEFILSIQNYVKAELIMNRFLEQLKDGLQVKDIAEVVVKAFMDYFGADGGLIVGYDRGEFHVMKGINSDINLENIKEDELFRVLTNNKTVEFSGLEMDSVKLSIVVGEITPKSVALIPMKYQEHNVGVCVLVSKDGFNKDLANMESRNFINQATPFLYNSTLIRRLEMIAAIDELTGVLNRRFGLKRLHEEFERAQRHGSSFSICMVDIDHFKKLNDTYGHQAGDKVLSVFTKMIETYLRSSDFIVRYGGEEFIIVLPGAAVNDALNIAERIRLAVESSEFQYGSFNIKYTFSGGICSYPSKRAVSVDSMITVADESLYNSKNNGRNRITIGE